MDVVEQGGSVQIGLANGLGALPKWGVERSGILAMFSPGRPQQYSPHTSTREQSHGD